jgi:hypothetical protein
MPMKRQQQMQLQQFSDVADNETASNTADTTLQTNIDNLVTATPMVLQPFNQKSHFSPNRSRIDTNEYSANGTTYITTSTSLVDATEDLDFAVAAVQAAKLMLMKRHQTLNYIANKHQYINFKWSNQLNQYHSYRNQHYQ